jgi:hypothetical protein
MQTQYYCYGCSINTTDFPVIKVYVTEFPVVNVHVDKLSSARIWQHKLCAIISANVNINYQSFDIQPRLIDWCLTPTVVRDSSAVRRLFFDLLEPCDVRELYIRKIADFPLLLCVDTFPRFVAIGFYFLSETLIPITSPIIFLFIHNYLTLRKSR